ncbi:MAG: hypothetical protein WBM13_01750 [Bacteroidia bacterium]
MKKTSLVVALALGASSVFAQNLTSKKGEFILPEAGDWGVSVNATPFLNYFGNFIGGNGLNTAPTTNFLSTNQSIMGKYFVDEQTAYRGGVRINFGSTSSAVKVPVIPAATPVTYVDDVTKVSGSNIGLTAGWEKRRGKTRLQGFYGGELGIMLGTSKTTTTYGNAVSVDNPVTRTKEIKAGSTFGLGLRGFIGAEYFILPKMSIGGEFGWGLAFSSTGEGETTTESWDGTAVVTTLTKTGKSSSFGFDTDNMNTVFGPAGTIRFGLHF